MHTDSEATPIEALWQAVLSAHLKWLLEIEERLGVKIHVSRSPPCQSFAYGAITGDHALLALDELWQREDHLSDLHTIITLLQGDPATGRRRYRDSADLYGRTPWQSLIDTGLYCIEAVLIGPDVRAAALLAVEPKLLAAARWRVKDSHDSDGFTPHVQTLIAMADSILAALAFDSVLEGGA